MQLRVVLAATVVVATGGFVLGTSIERNSAHREVVAAGPAVHVNSVHAVDRGVVPSAAIRETPANHAAERKPAPVPDNHAARERTAGESAATHAAEGRATSTTGPHAAPPPPNASAGTTATAGSVTTPTARTTGESAAAHAKEGAPGTAEAVHSELKPLGVDVEAVPFVATAALLSLLLALSGSLRPRQRSLLLVIAVAMLAFAALDVREVIHQHGENRTSLAILAGVVGALHLAATAVAALTAHRATQPTGPPPRPTADVAT